MKSSITVIRTHNAVVNDFFLIFSYIKIKYKMNSKALIKSLECTTQFITLFGYN